MIPALGRPFDLEEEAFWRRLNLVSYVQYLRPGKLLDVGCGNGLLVDCCKDAYGVDVVQHWDEDDRLQVCTSTWIPHKDKMFTTASCIEVLEHAEYETILLQEIHRVLQPYGLLIITVPNRWWLFETHNEWPWNRVPFINYLPWRNHWSRARCYTKRSLRILLEPNFQVMEIGYVTASLDVMRPRWLAKWVRNIFFSKDTTQLPVKATSIYAIARRLP